MLTRKPGLDVVISTNDDMAVGQSVPMLLSTIRSRRDTIGRIAATHILETPLRPPEPTIIDTGYEMVEGATA